MSELKRCPFCGEKMETTNHQQYFHPDNDCILHGFGIDISNRRSVKAWNTRKPMQDIVERLEEYEKHYTEQSMKWFDKGGDIYSMGCANRADGILKAIEIVKEEM